MPDQLGQFMSCSCTNGDLPMHRADCDARHLASAEILARMATPKEPPVGPGFVAKIRDRISDLKGQRERYLAYQADRVREGDNHAVWDSAIDINLCDYEIKGLEFALDAILADLNAK